MTKILFDASIHLGQFSTLDDTIRRACKNSQTKISMKPHVDTVGVITFNENSWVDHIIWTLPKDQQDAFYRFMDTFHSAANITRVPLGVSDCEIALAIAMEYNIDISPALSCAVAAREGVSEVHSLSPSLLTPEISKVLSQRYKLEIRYPSVTPIESFFVNNQVEQSYQDAFNILRESKIDLLELLRRYLNKK